MSFFDDLENRSQDAREADQLATLNGLISQDLHQLSDLQSLPVLRKSDLVSQQSANRPFGGIPTKNITHLFQSPGPIYEPGGAGDWWRLGRFAHASGFGSKDIIQNCFGYHLTPAGRMFESAAFAVGAKVFPAGTGQTELQVQAAEALGVTAYAGTPDYLKVILEKADELGVKLGITKAAVSGGALFPTLRQWYLDRGISCLQCYATADVGNIAYESAAMEGMIIDEGVIVEIVTPGTGDPVPEGEVGEVVVTNLNPDYPLVRFATGDMSAVMAGQSACGRTNKRIKGWMGRADQTTKIKGMFVRPEQVAELVASVPGLDRVRVVADRNGEADMMGVQCEGEGLSEDALSDRVREVLKLRGEVSIHTAGSLPRDGIVIEDRRTYDA